MASESQVELSLPADLGAWIDERAEALDVEPEELLAQLVGTYRVAADHEGDEPLIDGLEEQFELDVEAAAEAAAVAAAEDAIDDALEDATDKAIDEAIADALAEREADISASVGEEVDDRLTNIEDRLEEDLDEIRRRVVQVKRATEAKAPSGHDHEEFERVTVVEERLSTVEERLATVAERLGDLKSVVDDLQDEGGAAERSVPAGDRDDIESRLERVASAVVALQRANSTAHATDSRLTNIKREAAAEGITEATCDACDESVALAVLPTPACPHCGIDFQGIGSDGGLFDKPRLLTEGEPSDE